MESSGQSEKWGQYQGNVKRTWELLRSSTPERAQKYPVSWDVMTEKQLCCQDPYIDYSGYLVHDYVQETGVHKGELLKVSSVLGYIGCLINLASAKFKANGAPETKLFFTCLDGKSSTEPAAWLRGLRKNVTRELFQRMIELGEPMDASEIPIYLNDIREMVRTPLFCASKIVLIAFLRFGHIRLRARLKLPRESYRSNVCGRLVGELARPRGLTLTTLSGTRTSN